MEQWRKFAAQTLKSGSSLTRTIRSLLRDLTMAEGGKRITVCVEGNIGSGKTTLLEHFAQFPEVCTMTEPVEKWRNVDGHNLLDLMYRDPARWSCMFQSYVQRTMMDNHTLPVAEPIKMMERSIYSGRYCFIENLYKSELMSPPEYAVLDQWFQWITANIPVQPDLIVYLRSSPEVVAERIRRRARSEERQIPESYLHALHELHEEWLIHQSRFSVPCSVLVLDADKDLHTLKEEFISRKNDILCRGVVKSPVKESRPASARATV